MKTFKVSTSVGPYYVEDVTCGWNACQVAQQELGDGVEIDEYEENQNDHNV